MTTVDTSMNSSAGLKWLNDYLGGQYVDPGTLQLAEKITAKQLQGNYDIDGLDTRGAAIAGSKGTVNLRGAHGGHTGRGGRAHAQKPHDASYGQQNGQFYTVGSLRPDEPITIRRQDGTMAEVNAQHFFATLDKGLASSNPKTRARAEKQVEAFAAQGITRTKDGDWKLPIKRDTAAYTQYLGAQQAADPTAQALTDINKRMGTIAKWSWVPVAGSAVGAYQSAKIMGDLSQMASGNGLQASAAGMTAGAGGLALAGAGMSLGGSSALSNLGFVGMEGMQFKIKKVMNSIASNYGDDQMISMINSGNMPIEDLIAYFMAYMSEKYEQKLREKMEETAMQEKAERKRQMREDMIGGVAGIASMIPGVGTAVGAGLKLAGTAMNKMDTAMNGEQKSSTILMQEIQILTQKWKQVTELYSSLSKMLHDMSMSIIRKV